MLLYRIGKARHIADLSGEGARLFGGRWNYPGHRVLYTSESLALAVLEYITKTGAVNEELVNLKIAYIEMDDQVTQKGLMPQELPENWDGYPSPGTLKKIGTEWLLSMETLLLRVPAVSVPESFNVLINPLHPEFEKVTLQKVIDYYPDIRLKKI
jgi:RES domain-containing protein